MIAQALSGFSVTVGNPKAILFYLALLPSLIHADQLSAIKVLSLCLIVIVVLTGVFACYIVAAAKARQLISRRQSGQLFNGLTAAALIGAATWIATR